MAYYARHLFFCTNQKADGKPCCATGQPTTMSEYTKKKLKQLDLYGPAKHRVSVSGCLGRCRKGPALVVYPEGVWYRYTTSSDLDEIIEQHLVNGQPVERLMIEA